jgi:DNA-binding NtrC family response regulator
VTESRGKERTLTAVHSPFADGETPSVPVLFLIGAAMTGGPPASEARRRWWILPSQGAAPAGAELAVIGRSGTSGRDGGAEGRALPVPILLDDPLTSGRHARLLWQGQGQGQGQADEDGDRLLVEDLASKNGTFLAGERLVGARPLPQGVPLFVGEHVLVHRMVSPHQLLALEEEAEQPLGPVATASPALALTTQKLRRWASSSGEILLGGETGVGKEVYARAVHAASGRRGEFVAVNCAALPRELVESELFGYRAGAHSTARGDKPGLVERAAGGTLFLDEVGELPQEGQAKLLRFLQDRELLPLGGRQARRIDVAVVAATNRAVDVAAPGALRADILGRLGAAPVLLPPLRERLEDLGALCRHFLSRAAAPAATPAFELPAFRALCLHGFPLNVRELEKMLAAALALTGGTRPIALRDLPPLGPLPRAAPPSQPEKPAGRRAPAPGPSASELEALLAQHQGNVAEVSRALGRQRAAVWRWIKQFGLGVDRHRKP